MRCASLITGSKANAFYVEGENQSFLIDAGITPTKIQATLDLLGADSRKLAGIFLTHEHDDHVRYLRRAANQFKVPVFLSAPSYANTGFHFDDYRLIAPGDAIDFGDISIEAFRVEHDVDLCLGFIIRGEGKKMFFASDIGSYDDSILEKAEGSHFIGIEANYDPAMLQRCFYPQHLKDRISGGAGHLSNPEACRFIREAACSDTRHVMYLHLSENSNKVSVVEKMIDSELVPFRSDITHTIGRRHGNTSFITV